MTVSLHYTELRFARVKKYEDLVLGNNFLICHVPRVELSRGEAPASASRTKIVALAHMSYNEERRLEGGRVSHTGSLDDPRWVFRTDGPYARWHHCTDHDMEPAKWVRSNFVLDLDQLEADGVTVLTAYPQPVVSTYTINLYV